MIEIDTAYEKAIKVADGTRRMGLVGLIGALGRIDLRVKGKLVTATNIANDDFPHDGTMDKNMADWGLSRLREYRKCELCGRVRFAPPLATYDIDEFPELKDKVVCSNCRSNKYNRLITETMKDEKKERLSAFPKGGKIKMVDIDICTDTDCDCGWRVSVTGDIDQVKQLDLTGYVVHEKEGRLTVGGRSDQWMMLGRICQLMGAQLPVGYPPRKKLGYGGD